MAKIKLTKNELKAQRDALRRFERYLPTLQLKKQQLQAEVRRVESEIKAKAAEEDRVRKELSVWTKLFSEPFDFEEYLEIKSVDVRRGNIAGVNIPMLEKVDYHRSVPDLFASPSWVDDGMEALDQLMQLRVQRLVLEEQGRLLRKELRTTTQRVNLFEKVKIPECRNNIRTIRIFLGDQDTSAVARAKIAKGKATAKAAAQEV